MVTELDNLFGYIDIEEAILKLPEREQFVLRANILGYTHQEIGDFLGITRQGARDWLLKAVDSLEALGIPKMNEPVRIDSGAPKERYTNHPDISVYKGMMSRCYRPDFINYCYYGHLGVEVCSDWATDPMKFFEDMGPRPEGFSIDRIDPNGDYTPENCRWADSATQGNNKTDSGLSQETRDWFYRDTRGLVNKAARAYAERNREKVNQRVKDNYNKNRS